MRHIVPAVLEDSESGLQHVDLCDLLIDLFHIAMQYGVIVGDVALDLIQQFIEPDIESLDVPAADFIARVGETALDFLVEPIFDFIEEKLVSFENHLVAEFDFVEGRFVKDGAFDIVQFEATVVDDDLSDLLAFLLRKRGIIIRGDPVELGFVRRRT